MTEAKTRNCELLKAEIEEINEEITRMYNLIDRSADLLKALSDELNIIEKGQSELNELQAKINEDFESKLYVLEKICTRKKTNAGG